MAQQPQFNFKKITVKEAKRLIKEYNGIEDKSLENKYFTDIFLLNDCKVIQSFETHAFLYESLDELLRYWKYLDLKLSQNRISHVLKDKLLYTYDFADHERELISDAIITFKLKDSQPSSDGVKQISKFINKNKEMVITASIYSQVLAYIGHVMIHSLPDAKWQIIQRKDDKSIYEPYIISNSKSYNPFFFIYRELYENLPEEGKINLYEGMIMEMEK